jgi:rod shape-determining protein MreC
LIGVREENERLRQVNAELMLENSRMREAMLENQRLRSMLAFKSESEFDLLPANVIGKESSGPLRALLVSAGKNHGAEKDLAVVTSTGLLGKVFAALPDYSIVQLMTDRNFRVGALVRRSRVLGIVKWQEANIALLTEVPKRSDITTGDEVITSGQSLIFPGGIHIGKVIDVIDDEQEMFMEVKLQLATDSQIAEEVFVVKNRPVPFQ